MAHELEMRNGEASMAYVGEVPWHGLGKRVHHDLTPSQMLVEAGLDWEVTKEETFYVSNGEYKKAGIQALVRSDDNRVLTHVSGGWEPVQNLEAFEFFNEYVMAGDMEMHTAGSLKGGRIVWALAKVKESFDVVTPQGKDTVESYLLFTNPHKFGQSTDVRFTPIRVVCNNTLTMAINTKSSQMVKASHRKKFDASSVKETLGIANKYLTEYKDIAQFLSGKNYSDDSLKQYFTSVFPKTSGDETESSRNAERALDVVESQPGSQFAAGSWWQAYNTVTYMVDHELGRTASSRLESAWYGQNQGKKLNALKLAKQMAEIS